MVRYQQFKYNAINKGKEFTITPDQFIHFCNRTGYLIKKGMRGRAATIDRMCNVHGYHAWNIQLLTLRKNSSKGTSNNGDNFECPF